mmetsp:Transcript_38336/g.80667  ORF Transcript_38336/g.80667 Transcript_38336/m.80667 type:complete len:338 (-) Transcript_38336:343-1356(-)
MRSQQLTEGHLIHSPQPRFAVHGHACCCTRSVIQQRQLSKGITGNGTSHLVPIHDERDFSRAQNVEVSTCLALLDNGVSLVALIILKCIYQRLQLRFVKRIEHKVIRQGIQEKLHIIVTLFVNWGNEVGDHLLGCSVNVVETLRVDAGGATVSETLALDFDFEARFVVFGAIVEGHVFHFVRGITPLLRLSLRLGMHRNLLLTIGGILLPTPPPLGLLPLPLPILPRNRDLVPILVNLVLDALASRFALGLAMIGRFAFGSSVAVPSFGSVAIAAAFLLAMAGSFHFFAARIRSATRILLLWSKVHLSPSTLLGFIELAILFFANGLDFFEHVSLFS